MEIKPDVINVLISKGLDHLTHLLTNSILASFLIDKIDPILSLIILLSLFDVLLSSLVTLIEVWVDCDRRCPRHSRLHLPNKWDTATNLQVASKCEAAIGFLLRDDMFSLAEVGSVALTIKSSHNKSSAHSPCIFP